MFPSANLDFFPWLPLHAALVLLKRHGKSSVDDAIHTISVLVSTVSRGMVNKRIYRARAAVRLVITWMTFSTGFQCVGDFDARNGVRCPAEAGPSVTRLPPAP
jgi:hypothetical protein